MSAGRAERILVEIVGAHDAAAAELVGHRAMRYTSPALSSLLRLRPEDAQRGGSRYAMAGRFVVRDIGPAAFDDFDGTVA